jgi:predicted metal-dependent hydrolase
MRQPKRKLVIGRIEIPYSVTRSARRKRTIALIVEPGSNLTILAPMTTELPRIEALARRRAAWIVRKLAEIRERSLAPHSREFVDGESLTYLGRQYRLRARLTKESRASCKLRGGWMEIALPQSVSARNQRKEIAATIETWYRANAIARLTTRAKLWARRPGVAFGGLLITSQAKRWGSCDSANNIRINWRIMMAPLSLVDYVFAHELCHVKHKDHSDDFWLLLASVMPDCERRRSALKKLGANYSL